MSTMTLSSKVISAGNSAAVRLKASILESVGLSVGQLIEISVVKEGILIAPARVKAPVNINELVSRITPENCHGEQMSSAPVGREIIEW